MLHNLWKFIQLFLPYILLIKIYEHNKALPANIKTRTGRRLKAIMINTDCGILFSEEKYIANRSKILKEKQEEIDKISNSIIREINELGFDERESLYGSKE